jgi:WD40 repeat protein
LPLTLLLFLFPTVAWPAAPPGGLDRAGDPLPRGAIARCGIGRFRGQSDQTQALLSPDGRLLAVAVDDNHGRRSGDRIALFDATTGKFLRTIPLSYWAWSSAASVLAFTPSGDRLACLSRSDSTLRVYHTATGRELHRLLQARYHFAALAIDAKGALLAVGLQCWNTSARRVEDRTFVRLEVYSLQTGKRVVSFRPLHGNFVGLALSADGKQLASWGHAARGTKKPDVDEINCTVQLWDTMTGKELGRMKLPSPAVVGAFRGDGQQLALASGKSVYLCHPTTGTVQKRFVVPLWWVFRGEGQRQSPGSLTYSLDGRHLVCAAAEQGIRLVDLTTFEKVPSADIRVPQHLGVTLLGDGALRACGTDGARVVLWDVRSGKRLTHEEGHKREVQALQFAGPDRLWTASGPNGEMIEWDLTGRERRRNFLAAKDGKPLGTDFFPPVFSPGGRYLVRRGDREVTIHESATGKVIGPPIPADPERYTYHFSANDSLLVMQRRDHDYHFRLIRPDSGEELSDLWLDIGKRRNKRLSALSPAPSPDGRQVAVLVRHVSDRHGVSDDVSLQVYDTTPGWLRHTATHDLAQDCWQGGQVTFMPDGRHLMSIAANKEELLLHDVRSGHLAHTIRLPGPVHGPFAICPRGWMVAVPHNGDDGPAISVHEVSSGQALLVLPVRTDTTALAFSRDGRLLASGHASGTALVWDLFACHLLQKRFRPAVLVERVVDADASMAWQATLALLRTPKHAVELARAHLQAADRAPLPAAEVARLIARLDNDDLEVRERAQARLELLRRSAQPALEKALAGKPSPEARRRLQHLLAGRPLLYPRALVPSLRALALLELVGTTRAKAVLEEVAGWKSAPALAAEAKAALGRLKKGGGR